MDLAEIRALVARGHLLRGHRAARILGDDATQPVPVRVEALLLARYCAAGRQLFTEALGCAEQARRLAVGAGLQEQADVARLGIGMAYLDSGAPADAEEHLLAFLGAVARYPHLQHHRGAATYNLALCYERLRRAEAAVGLYAQAAALYEEAGHREWSVDAHHNAAWLLLRSGGADRAEEHLNHAALLLAHATPVQRANHIAIEGVCYWHQGHTDKAMDAAEEVLTPGCPGMAPWNRTCAAWLAGTIALAEGRPDLARVMLKAALKDAADSKDIALMNLVMDLRGRIGNPVA